MRFDYLHDAPPEALERLRALRIARSVRWPLAVLTAIVVTQAAASAIFTLAIGEARATEREAAVRLEASTAALARVRLAKVRVDDLVALDRQIREIRGSGSRVSARLADIANHVPAHAWLTTLARTPNGFEIIGKSSGLPALGATISSLMTSPAIVAPTLVRAGGEERRGALSFDIHAVDRLR